VQHEPGAPADDHDDHDHDGVDNIDDGFNEFDIVVFIVNHFRSVEQFERGTGHYGDHWAEHVGSRHRSDQPGQLAATGTGSSRLALALGLFVLTAGCAALAMSRRAHDGC
jgi:hypothetical protein